MRPNRLSLFNMSKTVFITGGSRGIGRACVRAFSREGWKVAFTYRSSEETAQALAAACGALAVQADGTDDDAVRCGVTAARAAYGAIDAVVCNAGAAEQKQFQDLCDADWLHMLNVNLMGAVRAIRAVLPDMLCRKSGSIVTVSSIWGQTGASCESHYAASKAALIALTRSLALELGPSGIRANCVLPGVIDTDMNAAHGAETLRQLAEDTPLGRLGTPEDVAESVVFLSGEKAAFLTGQTLGVTGGF